jgi:LPS-assembly protein
VLFASDAGAQNGLGLPLKLSGSHDGKVEVSGREFIYDAKSDTFIVKGDAALSQQTSHLTADELEFRRKQSEATATGDVRFNDPESQITASRAQLNTQDETAELSDAKLKAMEGTYYLAGKRITKLLGQNYSVNDGFFTTCGCESGRPAWSISAHEIDVHLGGRGTVKDARFNVLGVPIMAFPYAVFPANSERQTGLLGPRIGQSRLRGLQYLQPLFININRSQDATVALDVETAARVGAFGEYRIRNGPDDYLRVTGGILNESIRKNPESDVVDNQLADPHIPTNRWSVIGEFREHLTPNLTAFGDAVSNSDSLYLREINVYGLSRGYGSNFTTMRAGESHFGLLQSFDNAFLRVRGTWNQDLIEAQTFALQHLPEVLLSGRQKLLGGLAYADYDVQGTNFWRGTGVQGSRLDINPRVTAPWRLGNYVYGYGTVGARETVYDTSGHNITVTPVGTAGLTNNNQLSLGALGQGGLQDRRMIYAGSGMASVIERIYDVQWRRLRRLKHTIEPFANYNWVPSVNQSELPLFDQVDRVNPRSLVTYGAVSRIFAKYGDESERPSQEPREQEEAGNENLNGLGPDAPVTYSGPRTQVSELARLTLLQAYDVTHPVTSGGARLSDIQANASLFPTNVASMGSQVAYSPSERKVTYSSIYLNLRPPWEQLKAPKLSMGRSLAGGSFVQIAYNFFGGRFTSESVLIRAYYEMFDRVGLYYAPNYNLADGSLLSSEYGVRFKSVCDCWAVDLGATDTVNPNEVQFQLQITLGGIGSFGRNPFGVNPFRASSRPGVFSSQQF